MYEKYSNLSKEEELERHKRITTTLDKTKAIFDIMLAKKAEFHEKAKEIQDKKLDEAGSLAVMNFCNTIENIRFSAGKEHAIKVEAFLHDFARMMSNHDQEFAELIQRFTLRKLAQEDKEQSESKRGKSKYS